MLVPMGSSNGFLEGPIGGYFVRSRVRKQSDRFLTSPRSARGEVGAQRRVRGKARRSYELGISGSDNSALIRLTARQSDPKASNPANRVASPLPPPPQNRP